MASRSAPTRSRYYHRFSVAHGSRPPRYCTPSGLEQTPFAQKALMNWRWDPFVRPCCDLRLARSCDDVMGMSVGLHFGVGVWIFHKLKLPPVAALANTHAILVVLY